MTETNVKTTKVYRAFDVKTKVLSISQDEARRFVEKEAINLVVALNCKSKGVWSYEQLTVIPASSTKAINDLYMYDVYFILRRKKD